MAYENIENFLKMLRENNKEKPWEYNFEFECGDEKYAKLDALERYFTYKTQDEKSSYVEAKQFINEHSDYPSISDPDGSGKKYYSLTHTMYEKLWNWKRRRNSTFGICENKLNGILFGGDTMNSVQTVLGWIAGKNKSGKYSAHWTLNRWCTDKLLEELWTKKMGIEKYIDAYHTLGNFVLVPAYFNKQRGFNLRLYDGVKINDYWDLSLKYLKENGYGDFFPEHFIKYINYFFLWDYVDAIKEEKIYIPKTDLSKGLCVGEYDDNNEENCTRFFKTAVDLIKRRGKFMTAMLNIQLEKNESYKKIQEYLIGNEFCADSTFDAAKQILEQFNGKIPESAEMLLSELKEGKV